MTITPRKATLADEDAVLELLEQLFEPPGAFPRGYTRERGSRGFRHAITHPDADILLAVENETIIGLSTVYKDYLSLRDGWRTWLQDLVVDKHHRGRGVGKILLAASADWARQMGCTHVDLASGLGRTDAHRFYEREGMIKGSYTFRLHLD